MRRLQGVTGGRSSAWSKSSIRAFVFLLMLCLLSYSVRSLGAFSYVGGSGVPFTINHSLFTFKRRKLGYNDWQRFKLLYYNFPAEHWLIIRIIIWAINSDNNYDSNLNNDVPTAVVLSVNPVRCENSLRIIRSAGILNCACVRPVPVEHPEIQRRIAFATPDTVGRRRIISNMLVSVLSFVCHLC